MYTKKLVIKKIENSFQFSDHYHIIRINRRKRPKLTYEDNNEYVDHIKNIFYNFIQPYCISINSDKTLEDFTSFINDRLGQ